MKFVGRDRELTTLKQLYQGGGFQMPVIYGRRRIGKTSLINKFIHDTQAKETRGTPKATVFTARESSAKENLASLSGAILSLNQQGSSSALDEQSPSATFSSFEAAFDHLFRIARDQRIIFAIDEYPYLAESDRSVSSLLQRLIDENKANSQLFLILCGSSMSFMEHQVLGYKSPLYGRRTAQIKLEPFDIFQAAQLLDGVDVETVITWYGMVGGVPLYLEQFDAALALGQNLERSILRTDSFLYGEPDSFLQQELRDPSNYNAIIRTIANGVGKLTEIADGAGLDRTAVSSYLRSLDALGIVFPHKPIIDANRKKVRYVLGDNLFRFWYRFVPRFLTPLQAGREHQVAQLIEGEQLSAFLGASFEEVCRQWLVAHMGETVALATDSANGKRNGIQRNSLTIPLIMDIGSWWGTDRELRQEADIDIVALAENGTTIFGECKWRTKPTDANVIDTLCHRASLFAFPKHELVVFSKSPFTKACVKRAQEVGCHLITLADMNIA